MVRGILTPITSPQNPTDFDFRTVMRRKGIARKLIPTAEVFIQLPHKRSLKRWAYFIQKQLINQLHQTSLSADSKGLIIALALGSKKELSNERIEAYKRAGAMHLLAISGLHVGIILLLLRIVVNPLKRIPFGNIAATMLPIGFLWCFTLITGGSPSVVRAVTMFSFLQIGFALKRKSAPIHSVWISCIVLLFVQPRLLFDVGFQLSYSAVFGIVWMMPHWQNLFVNKSPMVRWVTSLFGLGCIAQLSVLPLSLFYFHQFPLLFWVSNLVLVPLLSIIISGAIGCILLSFLPSATWFYAISDFIFGSYQYVVAWIAKWEYFFIDYIPFRGLDAILLAATIVTLFLVVSRPKKLHLMLLGVVSLMFHLQLYMEWEKPPSMTVMHLYKNSLLLGAAKQHVIAIPGAKTPKIERMALQYQQHYRLKGIKYEPMRQSYHGLLVVDSLGIYKGLGTHQKVLLRTNPKIHLEELIRHVKPEIIIADGSSFPSYVERWKKTCAEFGVHFHHTADQGAYPLN